MVSLDLSSVNITDDALVALLRGCGNLLELDLSNTNIGDKGAMAIAENCPKLVSLGIRMLSNLTEKSLIPIARSCKGLKSLCAGWASITGNVITAIAESCPLLEQLDVSGSQDQLTDQGVEQISLLCPRLRIVDFSDCYNLTDRSLHLIAFNCKALHSVSISRCHNITVAAMRVLGAAPTMRKINLFGCYPAIFPHIQVCLFCGCFFPSFFQSLFTHTHTHAHTHTLHTNIHTFSLCHVCSVLTSFTRRRHAATWRSTRHSLGPLRSSQHAPSPRPLRGAAEGVCVCVCVCVCV